MYTVTKQIYNNKYIYRQIIAWLLNRLKHREKSRNNLTKL